MTAKRSVITIHDVAQKAGVSVSTVSRVLNDRVDVSRETLQKVQEVINALGYTSNLAARSMRSRKKNLIGLVVPDISSPYSIEVMRGVNRAIAETKYDLMVYTTGDIKKNSAAGHEQSYISLLNNSLTDGVVIVASSASECITDSPIVAVDAHMVHPNCPSIRATNYQGALEAVNHLIGLGHRRIGFIGGRAEIGSALLRLQGYQDALWKAGIGIDETLILPGDFSTETGYRLALQLFNLPTRPTAIFAGNDQAAIGVFQAAEESGLRIPQDVSLIGFDNISDAKYLGLTSVDQALVEMGYLAIQMLIKLINHEPLDSQTIEVPTRLVVRSSCQPLAAA